MNARTSNKPDFIENDQDSEPFISAYVAYDSDRIRRCRVSEDLADYHSPYQVNSYFF